MKITYFSADRQSNNQQEVFYLSGYTPFLKQTFSTIITKINDTSISSDESCMVVKDNDNFYKIETSFVEEKKNALEISFEYDIWNIPTVVYMAFMGSLVTEL